VLCSQRACTSLASSHLLNAAVSVLGVGPRVWFMAMRFHTKPPVFLNTWNSGGVLPTIPMPLILSLTLTSN